MLDFLRGEGVDPSDKTILDFASGYGRFTRFFVRTFKATWVSDLEVDMLDFNKRCLGANGFLSSQYMHSTGLPAGRKFDVVFCFSLFTHLPDRIWGDSLAKLLSLVEPGGYAFISVRGEELVRKVTGNSIAGECQFSTGNETKGRLDSACYGTMSVTNEYVQRKVGAIPGADIIRRFKMGECDLFQDVYVMKVGA